ncbi:MAG TPA: class I tRNA ligase family protein [bacterium]|nr:class I tRNA ligase family protein [bacterium]
MPNPRPIHEMESKWQAKWAAEKTYKAETGAKNEKFFGLVEFPFPSGEGLHVGHTRSYFALDAYTRRQRMLGKNVMFPMGWDAFGLPTENFAIKHKVRPQDATNKNVANFKRQMQSMGFGFDWDREINTTDPKYYKWTQWQFKQFFDSFYDREQKRARPIDQLPEYLVSIGKDPMQEKVDDYRMAFKGSSTINWCDKCKIGLANEEAVGGVCERCGSPVVEKEKSQWMIRITEYADRLLEDLDKVDYLDRVKSQQRNWIGKSEGARIKFRTNTDDVITVFTTRPDTIFGVTYVTLAPEHELVSSWLKGGFIKNSDEAKAYISAASAKTEEERQAEQQTKSGVKLEGITVTNPVNSEVVPVFISDYVLAGYGTGAVMAVPAHDDRDFAFAKAFDLPIKQVVAEHHIDVKNPPVEGKPTVARKTVQALIRDPKNGKILCLNWKKHPWTTFVIGGVEGDEDPVDAILREIKEETGYTNLSLVRQLGPSLVAEYFAAHKNENRYADVTGYLFELISDEHEIISAEEQEKHELVWLDRSEITPERMTCSELGAWMWNLDHPEGRAFTDNGIAVNSDFINGLPTWKAKMDMTSWLTEYGKGEYAATFRLRDWVFSRQRYWGEPMPIIHCDQCGFVAVPDDQLPVVLPEVEAYEPGEDGSSPLAKIDEWVNTSCPSCGGKAKRETDVMPNWAGSSWYFLRYCDPHNDEAFASQEAMNYWMPVNLYNGGMEHTTLHLLYSRFWHKFLWDLGHIPKEVGPEPYAKRRSHGLVMAEGGEKMSKSKGNVVNPDDVIAAHGADVFKVYELFMGPFDQAVPWDTNGIEGVKRFLDKIWQLFDRENEVPEASAALETLYHQTVKKVGEGIDELQFNTCVSSLMILVNAFQDHGGIPASMKKGFVGIVAPFIPHLSEELWMKLGEKGSVHLSAWPKYNESKLVADTFELVVQVNGKVRAKLQASTSITEEEAKALALNAEGIATWLDGKEPKKVIYIKGKLVSIVM